MLRVCLALVVIAALTRASEADIHVSHLLDRSALATAYSGQSDLITAYTTGMARYRLLLAGVTGTADLAAPLEPLALRPEFQQRTWRSADGSLLQGFAGKGGFRLTTGNCVARICVASECSEAGWPLYACSDGRKRKMSVKSFVTATFDGVSYRRLSAPRE
ncbi:hypothetical protein SAMN03159463_00706 [Mesorhizobium sp. NFR06]|uniref:hypothetical protein n=1 Tax=Mesorhizobium sp. NFR06 TaxID=1566290 RepID=UPI0008E9B2C1|nr:hypothetical protein [Mesorhizobium sp. NFR06]SFN84787.1 hypothetical protein SAMN03159463_00706 [Mesorhizobium sp. NFR06]